LTLDYILLYKVVFLKQRNI